MTAEILFVKNHFPEKYHDRIAIVGGTVRDFMLGKDSQDIDLVTDLPEAAFLTMGFRLVEATSSANIYFKYHHSYGKIEVTSIDSMAKLNEDLRLRDFTVNAMAMDLAGVHIDPLNGKADLQSGLLRACSDHTFTGDPLRIFRAFRFEADGWKMTPETVKLVMNNVWHTSFRQMPVERFSNEMLKALAMTSPERFFERMIELNVGTEFLPELFRMPQIPAGPLEHHPEGDLFTHSTQVLQRAAERTTDPRARFCAFFHDLGKLATDPALYPKHHGHDETGFEMATEFCNRLCLPVTYRRALASVCRLHGKANKWEELRDSTKIKMAEQAIKAGIADILALVSVADKPDGVPMFGWDDAVRVAVMNTRELGIDLEKLESMPIENRSSYILQKRVEALRSKQI